MNLLCALRRFPEKRILAVHVLLVQHSSWRQSILSVWETVLFFQHVEQISQHTWFCISSRYHIPSCFLKWIFPHFKRCWEKSLFWVWKRSLSIRLFRIHNKNPYGWHKASFLARTFQILQVTSLVTREKNPFSGAFWNCGKYSNHLECLALFEAEIFKNGLFPHVSFPQVRKIFQHPSFSLS